jgi:hypothetical protein
MIPAVTDIFSIENNQVLELNYTCKVKHASYCIADFGGNVIMRGHLDALDNKKISIGNLGKGLYTLCIVDGDILIKNRFQKNQ